MDRGRCLRFRSGPGMGIQAYSWRGLVRLRVGGSSAGMLSIDRADDGRDESITLSRDGLDESRPLSVISERAANLGYRAFQLVFSDEKVFPDRVEQCLFLDRSALVLYEKHQGLEWLAGQMDRLPCSRYNACRSKSRVNSTEAEEGFGRLDFRRSIAQGHPF